MKEKIGSSYLPKIESPTQLPPLKNVFSTSDTGYSSPFESSASNGADGVWSRNWRVGSYGHVIG